MKPIKPATCTTWIEKETTYKKRPAFPFFAAIPAKQKKEKWSFKSKLALIKDRFQFKQDDLYKFRASEIRDAQASLLKATFVPPPEGRDVVDRGRMSSKWIIYFGRTEVTDHDAYWHLGHVRVVAQVLFYHPGGWGITTQGW